MTKQPLVSVFMAAYNAGNFIEASILSVLNQTFQNFELIIVNDGSTDHTATVVEKFNDARIRLIHNPENLGLFATRQRMLELAEGDFIAILDSDDLALPHRLEMQVDYMQKNPKVALCGGHAAVIDEFGNLTGVKFIEPVDHTIEMFMLFGNPYINSAVLFRTSVFRELGGYRSYAPAEDFELFTRMVAKYQVANLNETLVHYRIHGNNTSIKDRSDQVQNEVRILENLRADLGMPADERLSAIHFSIFRQQLKEFSAEDYAYFLSQIKVANQSQHRYDQQALAGFLFEKWVDILKEKKAKNSLRLLFDQRLFEWKYCQLKHIRKAFKLTLKALFR